MAVQRLDADELMKGMQEQAALADQIEQETGVPHITAFIMAGDRMSAQRARERLDSGEWDVDRAINLTGSYARFDFALSLVDEKRLSPEDFYRMLPELWRGSDPDDTNPEYLRLWIAAWKQNGRRTVCDGKPPAAKFGPLIPVFRGQMEGDPFGIAWTTNMNIAQKFAGGAGVRTPMGGIVYRGWVPRKHVLAYLTERGESEVIVDPKYIKEHN
jgi:hypothetical protein